MSKKTSGRDKHEDKDLEEEEDERDDEEEEDAEDEEAHAHPATASAARRGRAARDHDDEREEEAADEDDPYWWTPHAVMGGLVLVGVLGFFGVFNKVLGGILPVPARPASEKTTMAAATPQAPIHAPTPPTPAAAPTAQGQEFGARHLLVQYKGSQRAAPGVTRTEEEAKTRATEAMKKAKGGAKFEDLVKEYSDEPNAAQRGGDLGKFRRGSMVPDFQNAVEKLKVGEVSDLVKTPFGYHVILRTL
jgi:parvulin-like peptidyl-prolyl isomerase